MKILSKRLEVIKKVQLPKNLIVLFSLVGISLIIVGYASWQLFFGKETDVAAAAATVAARTGEIEVKISGTGSLQPTVTKNITTSGNGKIKSINFSNGQQVKEGDLLFEIDLDTEDIELEVKKAELQVKQAKSEYNSTLEQSEKQTSYASISGQVSSIEVSEGQEVQKGAVLMQISDTSKVVFDVTVPLDQASNIKQGQTADVSISATGVQVQGKVKSIDGEIVTIEVTNNLNLKAGQEAQAVINTVEGAIVGQSTGKLQWIETTVVKSNVSGTVKDIKVSENTTVKKGQSVALIKIDNLDSQLESQQLNIQQANLSLENAKSNLVDSKIYAPVDGIFTLGTAQTQSASSNTGSISGSNGSAGLGSSNTSSSNTSGQTHWQEGDEVGSGQTLATILGNNEMSVKVSVDEVDIAKVELGQEATIIADASPEKTFTGEVIDVATQGTQSNGVATFDVTVSVKEPEGLKPNMSANVEIMVAKKGNALLLPIEAVLERQGKKFVSLNTADQSSDAQNLDQETPENSPRRMNMTEVETGLYNESYIEIISGLEEGDVIVLPTTTATGSTGQNGARQGFGGQGGMMPGGMVPGGGGMRPEGSGGFRVRSN